MKKLFFSAAHMASHALMGVLIMQDQNDEDLFTGLPKKDETDVTFYITEPSEISEPPFEAETYIEEKYADTEFLTPFSEISAHEDKEQYTAPFSHGEPESKRFFLTTFETDRPEEEEKYLSIFPDAVPISFDTSLNIVETSSFSEGYLNKIITGKLDLTYDDPFLISQVDDARAAYAYTLHQEHVVLPKRDIIGAFRTARDSLILAQTSQEAEKARIEGNVIINPKKYKNTHNATTKILQRDSSLFKGKPVIGLEIGFAEKEFKNLGMPFWEALEWEWVCRPNSVDQNIHGRWNVLAAAIKEKKRNYFAETGENLTLWKAIEIEEERLRKLQKTDNEFSKLNLSEDEVRRWAWVFDPFTKEGADKEKLGKLITKAKADYFQETGEELTLQKAVEIRAANMSAKKFLI